MLGGGIDALPRLAPRLSLFAGRPQGLESPILYLRKYTGICLVILLTVLFLVFCDQLLNRCARIVSQASFKESCAVRVIDRQAAAF